MNNQGPNIGHSSRLDYDRCAYNDYITESTKPFEYRMDTNSITNCNACLSTLGPRPSMGSNSFGVSTYTDPYVITPAQKNVDVESVLSNRNMIASKCKNSKVNDINVSDYGLKHARICGDFLNPISTHLTNPPENYKGISINRFYNLHKNPQENIFYNFAVNTSLQAKDNFHHKPPKLKNYDRSLPKPKNGKRKNCKFNCS